MIRTILKILAILLLAFVQFFLVSKISVLGVIPNLILILAIVLVLNNRFSDAILVALVGGLILDLGSPLRFGLYTFFFLAILLIIYFIILRSIPSPNNLTAFLIFSASFLFLDLGIFLSLGVWPSWPVLVWAIISGFWGLLFFVLLSPKIITNEEINVNF